MIVLGALVVVAWVPLWWWGAPGSRLAFALLPVTPLVPVVALVVAAVAAGTGRWVSATAATLAMLVLGAVVLPRAVADGLPAPGGGLTVATANLQYGQADAAAVVAMVRARRVDVLSLQELTPDAERRLDAAGLATELPHRLTRALDGAGGTGLLARHPLAPADLGLAPTTFAQVSARMAPPGATDPVELVAVHPVAPLPPATPRRWAAEIRSLPAPSEGARLVLGDFNATLDHRPLRDLLATGYRDAAEQAGAGLRATWPTDSSLPPFAAIDHVLLAGAAARSVAVVRLPGTDHAAVIADVAVGP